MARQVHKFGGSSLSSAERYLHVAKLVKSHCSQGDAVVVSASGSTTNHLVSLWQAYQLQDKQDIHDRLQVISNHQTGLIQTALTNKVQQQALAQLQQDMIALHENLRQRSAKQAEVLALGELWSARLLANCLQQQGCSAVAHDARQLLCIENNQLDNEINQQQCAQLDQHNLHVITGFIASDQQGNTVTLGRNGSDYSATLFARYLQASDVTIWTDTQGVYSCDPRKVRSAIKYNKLCRSQAKLLASLGNPVLHEKTLSPLQNTAIRLQVRSSFEVEELGTAIVQEGQCSNKAFITTLEKVDLLRVVTAENAKLTSLLAQTQHTVLRLQHQQHTYLVAKKADSALLRKQLGAQLQLVESNLNGCALVAQSNELASFSQKVTNSLSQQAITVRFIHQATEFSLFLTDQLIGADVLRQLHHYLPNPQQVALIVAGVGNVGETFLTQLVAQQARLAAKQQVSVVAILRSKEMLFSPAGIDPNHWQTHWQSHATSYQTDELFACIDNLDHPHKVVIDITASEDFAMLYPDFAARKCHLISANKYPATAELSWYNNLRSTLAKQQLQWRANTSVGAGLPINYAIEDLQKSGDTISRIQGVFSGTLSWLFAHYKAGDSFSQLVIKAKELGLTEPDPREDLSGRDVQRKLLILARSLGLNLNLDDIELTPCMPEKLIEGDWQSSLAYAKELDDFIANYAKKAQRNQGVLRYNADLQISEAGKATAKVGLEVVAGDHPLATLKAGDNMFVINSNFYHATPMVIQGSGAGKAVTAAGIHSDLYWLLQQL